MKILILSDTHGNTNAVLKILERENAIDYIFHLGDGIEDIYKAREKISCPKCYAVRGNCDESLETPPEMVLNLEDCKIFLTHGDGYGVKNTTSALYQSAREKNADIAIFGHSHKQLYQYESGIFMFNSGAVLADLGKTSEYGILVLNQGETPIFEHKCL